MNYVLYGDMFFMYIDCVFDVNEFIVLVYIVFEWDIEWGGEMLFYDNNDDCLFVCILKFVCVVIFYGVIKYVGRLFNRICYMFCYILVFKLEKV